MYRGQIGNYSKLCFDRLNYNCIVKFLNSKINRNINSLDDRTEEKWITLLKGWMMEQGISTIKKKKVFMELLLMEKQKKYCILEES